MFNSVLVLLQKYLIPIECIKHIAPMVARNKHNSLWQWKTMQTT